MTLLCTESHKLGIEVVLWHQSLSNTKVCKVCEEGLVEVEYHFPFICSVYSVIIESFDDILRGSDESSVILKRTPKRLSSYMYALLTH